MWAKDLARSVDYLVTRRDIANDTIGLLGFSWGAANVPLLLTVEPRISIGIIASGASICSRRYRKSIR
jgi:dienelactone hydrolase